jgi:hypothetical protein
MILKLILMAALSIGTVASVWAAPPEAQQPVDVAFEVEALRLREALVREVRGALRPDPARDAQWIDLARAETTASNMVIDRPQLVVVVDRNPRVQALMVVLALPQGDWKVIGGSRVSTGQRGRFDHYVTPTGVFHLTDAILGYRAEGTLNENGIRGLGAKGMRVWDFGWHVAMKGWTEVAGKPDRTPIRLMLHATDPDKLEQRIAGLHPHSDHDESLPRPARRARRRVRARRGQRHPLPRPAPAGSRPLAGRGQHADRGGFRRANPNRCNPGPRHLQLTRRPSAACLRPNGGKDRP